MATFTSDKTSTKTKNATVVYQVNFDGTLLPSNKAQAVYIEPMVLFPSHIFNVFVYAHKIVLLVVDIGLL